MKVVLDTNVLLLFGQGIDVFSEIAAAMDEKFSFVVPELVLKELEALAAKKSKDGRAAKLGYAIVQRKLQKQPLMARLLFGNKEIPLKTVPCSETHADDAILRIAEDGAIVATLDKALQRRLLKKSIGVLKLTGKRFERC